MTEISFGNNNKRILAQGLIQPTVEGKGQAGSSAAGSGSSREFSLGKM
jgi:hypothetical protein